MSVDTRTPRTPTGGRSPGFDDEPVLSSVKVPCDPAQVIVNHASFRVQLAAPVGEQRATADAARIPVIRGRRRGQTPGARGVERPHGPGRHGRRHHPDSCTRYATPASAWTAATGEDDGHDDPGPAPGRARRRGPRLDRDRPARPHRLRHAPCCAAYAPWAAPTATTPTGRHAGRVGDGYDDGYDDRFDARGATTPAPSGAAATPSGTRTTPAAG